jgi:hypothetical protein
MYGYGGYGSFEGTNPGRVGGGGTEEGRKWWGWWCFISSFPVVVVGFSFEANRVVVAIVVAVVVVEGGRGGMYGYGYDEYVGFEVLLPYIVVDPVVVGATVAGRSIGDVCDWNTG